MTGVDSEGLAAAGVRRVGLNAFFLLAAYVLPRVFTVGSILLAARVLGAERFGVYGAASAFAVILAVVGALGMHPLLVRDLARDPASAPRLLAAAHVVKLGASAVLIGLAWLLPHGGIGLDRSLLVPGLLLSLSWVAAAFGENFSAYYQALERMQVWTQASALFGVLSGVLGAALVLATRSVVWFCVGPLVGQIAALVWMIRRAPPELRRWQRPRAEDVVRLLRAVAPFSAAFIALTLHYKLDVLLIERWRGPADVGIYSAAYKFIDVYQALVLVAIGALYPRLSRSAVRSAERPVGAGWWAGRRAAELCLLVGVAVGGALHIAAPGVIRLAFGAQYAASAVVAGWLALAMPALATNLLGSYLLGAAHRMGWAAGLYGGGLALKTTLDALLVPSFGPLGAGIAMAAAELALAVAVLFALRRAHAAPSARALGAAALAAALIPVATLAHDPTGGWIAALLWLAAALAIFARAGIVGTVESAALRGALRRPAPPITVGAEVR